MHSRIRWVPKAGVWLNDCILGKFGQSTNPIIAKVDPVPYYSMEHVYVCESLAIKGAPARK